MAGIEADAKYIGEFGDYVRNNVHPTIGWAAAQASAYGCEKDGFIGLLMPLQVAMDLLAQLVDEAGKLMADKMTGTYQGLYATANEYAGMEANNTRNITESGRY